MRYQQQQEAKVKERIVNDLAGHTITVMHEAGLYRHYRCQRPGTWCMGFDIVTWPGSLCYTGDMGDYLFQRADDMIAFMSSAIRDHSYVAQKCVAGKVKEWREERFEEVLRERLKQSRADGSEGRHRVMRRGVWVEASVTEKIKEIRREYDNYCSQHDAMKAMYESGLWDSCELPSCEVYTFHFLWCLHAIKWFCDKLKGVKA